MPGPTTSVAAGRSGGTFFLDCHPSATRSAGPALTGPESPAIALGFKPYDWSQAGVVGDPAWVARAREGWEAPACRP